MKKLIYNILLLFVSITTCSTLFTSCKDDELPDATRLFRPILADDNVVAALSSDTVPYIQLSWDKYTGADEFVVKVIAADGTDSATITTDSTGCVFNNVKFDKEYTIKIHSVGKSSGLQSKDYVTSVTTPDFPTQLINITSSNIIDTQVRLSWNTSSNGLATVFDSIKVYDITHDSLVVSNAVSSSELTAGQKIIRKLTASTNYRVEAYNKGKYKGKKLFKTTAAESYSGVVVDLRGLTAEDSYKYFSVGSTSTYVNRVDSIIKSNPNQDVTIVLQGGVTYRMPTLTVPSTTGVVRFVTGLSLNGNAIFAVSGNFDAAASTVIGGLKFEKILFTEAPLEGKGKNSDTNFGGTYLFNFSGAASEVKSIKITNCTIKYKRGILRCKDAAVIDTISIDNTICDSIAGYGVINAEHASSKITNIKVTNSTFSNCQVLFSGTKQAASPINSIDIESSTFVYCVTNKGSIFNYSGCTVSSFILKACVFGIGGKNSTELSSLDATSLTYYQNGIKGWTGTVVPTVSDCYFTSDYLWVKGSDMVTPTAQIAGTSLTTNTSATFTAPVSGNFKVLNTVLSKNKIGDPRWW